MCNIIHILLFLLTPTECQILRSESSSPIRRRLSPESSIIDELNSQLAEGTQMPRLTLSARRNDVSSSQTQSEFLPADFEIDVVVADPSVTSSTIISHGGSISVQVDSSIQYLISDVDGFAILAVDRNGRSVEGIIQIDGDLFKFEQLNETESVVMKIDYDIPNDWECSVGHGEEDQRSTLFPEVLEDIHTLHPYTDRRLYATDSFPQRYTYQVDLFIEVDEGLVNFHDPGNPSEMPNTIEYVNALVTSVSSVYEREIDTHLNVLHIAVSTLYDDAHNTSEALNIMKEAYGNRPKWHYQDPMTGMRPDVHHAMLYKKLGGGIAYLGTVCDSSSGFGLTSGIRGTISKITDGAMFWDFLVTAHEIGHNFGSRHTHDIKGYSPLIDQCGTKDASGKNQCKSLVDGSQVSAGGATIMSYCHQCKNGVSNIAATFGGYWNGGDRKNIDNWEDNEGVIPFSQGPKRVPKIMYQHVKSRGLCVQPDSIQVLNQTCNQNEDCFDGNSCTVDSCNILMQQCSNFVQHSCCGNHICEENEFNCSDCGPFTIEMPSCSSCLVPYGVMFDVEATNDIFLSGLTLKLNKGMNDIIIYTAPGGYSDKKTNASAWTQVHNRSYSVPDWKYITVNLTAIEMNMESRRAFYIHSSNRVATRKFNETLSQFVSDENIRLLKQSRGVVDEKFGAGYNDNVSWVGSVMYSIQALSSSSAPTKSQSTSPSTGPSISGPTNPSISPFLPSSERPTLHPTANTPYPQLSTAFPSEQPSISPSILFYSVDLCHRGCGSFPNVNEFKDLILTYIACSSAQCNVNIIAHSSQCVSCNFDSLASLQDENSTLLSSAIIFQIVSDYPLDEEIVATNLNINIANSNEYLASTGSSFRVNSAYTNTTRQPTRAKTYKPVGTR